MTSLRPITRHRHSRKLPDSEKSGLKEEAWSILKLLNWTQSYFESHIIDSPRLTAEMLLAHCLGLKRLDLYLQYDRPLEKQELAGFKALIKRRVSGEPVAYITGNRGFYDAEFEVTQDVLIPRPETELLVEESIDILQQITQRGRTARVLDLGTGSGAIVVSLAKACPQHVFFATDISEKALQVARKNAARIVPGMIDFSSGEWFNAVPSGQLFDLIVSNPPYIPTPDIEVLQTEVKKFEPLGALDGGPDGLDCYRVLIERAAGFLSAQGVLLMEIGYDQKPALQRISQSHPFYHPPVFKKDLSGHNRVVILKKIN